MKTRSTFPVVALVLAGFCGSAFADGTVIVTSDDWTLSNTGFSTSPTTSQFVSNLTSEFADGGPGNFLAYSRSFGFTGSELSRTMQTLGHQWTVSTSVPFNLNSLMNYDGIFLGGSGVPDIQVLIDYLYAGGNIYLLGGAGGFSGGSAGEARAWEPLLSEVGFAYGSTYNGVAGTSSPGSDPLFSGVTSLYQNNGQFVFDLDLTDGNKIISGGTTSGTVGRGQVSVIPAPATAALLGFAPCMLRRRRK